MSNEEFIRQLENYVECWKQFNQFLRAASSGNFSTEDEEHFLELKSILAQELELVLSHDESATLNRTEIHDLISSVPSLKFLTDARDDSLRQAENRWHKIYIQWQSLLGQMKVKVRASGGGGGKSSLADWFR